MKPCFGESFKRGAGLLERVLGSLSELDGCFSKLRGGSFWWVSFLQAPYYVGSVLRPLNFRNSHLWYMPNRN